jgi:hypothetical protein
MAHAGPLAIGRFRLVRHSLAVDVGSRRFTADSTIDTTGPPGRAYDDGAEDEDGSLRILGPARYNFGGPVEFPESPPSGQIER